MLKQVQHLYMVTSTKASFRKYWTALTGMETPRKPDMVIDESNDLNRLIEYTHKTLRQFPNDRLLQIALRQDKHQKKVLLEELHQSLTLYLEAA